MRQMKFIIYHKLKLVLQVSGSGGFSKSSVALLVHVAAWHVIGRLRVRAPLSVHQERVNPDHKVKMSSYVQIPVEVGLAR